MLINAVTAKMLITFPHNIIVVCKNAAWISSIYIVLLAALLFGLICMVYSSDKNVIELAEKYGGKPLRTFTGLAVFAVLFLNFFSQIRIFPEAIRLVLLQTSYVELIGLLLAVGLVLGAYCGLGAVARLQELFLPIAGIVFALFILFLIPTVTNDNIFPLLGDGAQSLFIDNISFLSVFTDLLLLNLLLPYMENAKDYKRSGFKVIAIGGAVIVIIVTTYCLSYPYPVTEKYLMPVYQLERLIRLGNFFSRLEAVFQFIWSISILLYGSLYIFMMSEVWRSGFGLKQSQPLILPVTAIMIGASVIPDSLAGMVNWETQINKWLYIPAFAIPLIFGITDKLFHVKHLSKDGELK